MYRPSSLQDRPGNQRCPRGRNPRFAIAYRLVAGPTEEDSAKAASVATEQVVPLGMRTKTGGVGAGAATEPAAVIDFLLGMTFVGRSVAESPLRRKRERVLYRNFAQPGELADEY